jgi:hypothetical protein
MSPDSPSFPVSPLKLAKRSSRRLDPGTSAPPRQLGKPIRLKRVGPASVISPSTLGANMKQTSRTKSCEDELDEKIHSILTSIPGRIHLTSNSDGTSDSRKSDSRRHLSLNANSRAVSPASTRSSTPTPSLTLTRSRRSYGPTDESSVKVYHLHRGEKSAPTKLFVRSVGEDGERVMVRVGGGWADLGEYLREYVLHHGRRKVTEDRFEIRGMPTKTHPSRIHSSGRLTPTLAPSSGRTTPVARPGSAFDFRRPSSSLSVRKTRRLTVGEADSPKFEVSNPSDQPVLNVETPSQHPRESTASFVSVETPATPPSAHRSTPLGLAGPKPRSRHVSMSPESEAWVEGVMGEARKKTATLRHQFSSGTLRNLPPLVEAETKPDQKLRSVSDIGGGSLNKRVYLRGLNK